MPRTYSNFVNTGFNPANPSGDAFGRLRVSNPTSLFYSSLQYGWETQDDVWEFKEVNTGDITTQTGYIKLATAASGDECIMQTRQYNRYQPGKSQLVKVTGSFGDATTGTTKRLGYFDANNGVFVQQDPDGTIKLVVRKYGSDTAVAQSSWNIDTCTGYDFSKAMIFFCDIEWLGVGSVRCGFVIDGEFRFAHAFHHAGVVSYAYMETASLPIRYHIIQSGGTSGSMNAVCAAVDSEGGSNEEFGHPFAIGNDFTGISCLASTMRPVLSIRPALLFNGKTNRTGVRVIDLNVYVTGNPAVVEIVTHAALTGGTWAAVDAHSAMEFSRDSTGYSGGHVIQQFTVSTSGTGAAVRGSANSNLIQRLPIALDIAGTSQRYGISVIAGGLGGTSVVYAAANWVEVY